MKILALLNNSIESFLEKGLADQYPRYINVCNLFSEVHVLYCYTRPYDSKWRGMQIHRVIFIPYLYFIFMIIRSILICIKERIDVIRAYNSQLEGLTAVIAGILTNTPTVISVHGNYDELVKVRGYSPLIRFLVHVIELFVLKKANMIFAVSDGVAEDIIRKGIPRNKVKVTYNKVDAEKFYNAVNDINLRAKGRKLLDINEKDFIILHVGRFNPQKNIPVLFYAIKKLRDCGIPAKLILIGDDPKETTINKRIDKPLRPIFEEKINKLGIREHVYMLGFIPHDKLRMYYALSDVFVFPTLVYGFGIALAEAQSAGLPIVASNILYQGDKGCLVSPQNSILFDPNNIEELCNNLINLFKSENLRKTLSMQSLKSSKKFSWEIMAQREAAYYRELIERETKRA